MCLYELLKRVNSCRVSPWTPDTIDEILIEGDAMYMKAFELTMTPFPIEKHYCWRIYPIKYTGLR